MKKILLILLFLCPLHYYGYCIEPADVLKHTVDEYFKRSSISYNIDYHAKYFSTDDTIAFEGTCTLIRDTNDKAMKGIVWFTVSDSIEKYYNGKTIYLINNNSKSYWEYPAADGNISPIMGNAAAGLIRTYFLDPRDISKMVNDSTITLFLSDTAILGKEYWVVTMQYQPKPPDESDKVRKIWIEKNNYLICRITYQTKFQEEWQYNEWNLHNIKFNKTGKQAIEKAVQNKLSSYRLIKDSSMMKPRVKPLANGEKAPGFEGTLYSSRSKVCQNDYKNRVILMDFWYMSCYWCIKAMPHINELFAKYNEKGLVVLGMNPYDSSAAGLKRLPKFIEINKTAYPIVFIGTDVPKSYHVTGYPTLYVIDKKGEIVFSQEGFSEDLKDKLEAVIKKELE